MESSHPQEHRFERIDRRAARGEPKRRAVDDVEGQRPIHEAETIRGDSGGCKIAAALRERADADNRRYRPCVRREELALRQELQNRRPEEREEKRKGRGKEERRAHTLQGERTRILPFGGDFRGKGEDGEKERRRQNRREIGEARDHVIRGGFGCGETLANRRHLNEQGKSRNKGREREDAEETHDARGDFTRPIALGGNGELFAQGEE